MKITTHNRTGLHLLIGEKRIVEIENIDMETVTGRFKREAEEFDNTQIVTLWLDFELACKYEEMLEAGRRIEVVGRTFTQPNGRVYLKPEYAFYLN